MAPFLARRRIPISIAVSVTLIVYLLFARPLIMEEGALSESMKYIGFALMVFASMGRIWCGTYICGHKTKKLVTAGPYSLHRNPLYVYSFFGAVGFGIAARNAIFAALVALLFVVLYPTIVAAEEVKLRDIHGEAFEEYCRTTPRWLPRFSNYNVPYFNDIQMKKMSDLVRDAGLFIGLFIVADLIFELHRRNILPIYW